MTALPCTVIVRSEAGSPAKFVRDGIVADVTTCT
jgi:hypothetical protein